MNPSYNITNKSVTVVFDDGVPLILNSSHKEQYEKALKAIKAKRWKDLRKCFDVVSGFKSSKFEFKNGKGFLNGKPMNSNAVLRKISYLWENGLPIDPMVKFFNNVLQNPNPEAVEDLYLFLENGTFTLTEDGCFLAWRKVDYDYLSYHPNPDGTRNRNIPGSIITKDRDECDSNRNNTCSRGLHFCSWAYLPCYHGGQGRTMLVKINPKNVVSIPTDYNKAKGRCCEYEVIREVVGGEKTSECILSSSPVWPANGPTCVIKDNKVSLMSLMGQAKKQQRDSRGRFTSKMA